MSGETDNDGDHCDTDERASPEEVYEMQASPGAATLRDVTETISRQLLVARHVHRFSDANGGPPRDVLKSCKEFLAMNSVSTLPPALAAVHGFGTLPFLLYKYEGFDKLHAIDLGIVRDVTDKAFIVFGSSSYNKSTLTKMGLVRIVNRRFQDLPRSCAPTSMSPFRSSDSEKHANMTGS